MSAKRRALILCTGNSARPQMAEGLLRHDAGDRFSIERAGIEPSHVRPEAIAVMAELESDISAQRSKHVDEFRGQSFDNVITLCDNARQSCPIFPAATRRLRRDLDDPAAFRGSETERLILFRRVRDELRAYLRAFAKEESPDHA